MVKTTNEELTPFLIGHEGFVGKAYRDSGGVITIGIGFTMLSDVFASWWLANKGGHKLRMGDRMTRAEADQVLAVLVRTEYAPPVDQAMPDNLTQHAFNGSTSVTYNAGAGTLRDRWAVALAKGDVKRAATLLRKTRVTARGRRIQGLVNRRASEARLIEHGDYGAHSGAEVSTRRDAVKAYQTQLKVLGYYEGEVDGIAGGETHAATIQFQRVHGLEIDGIVGPATRATLTRAVDAKRQKQITAGGVTGGAVGGGGTEKALSPDTITDVVLDSATIMSAVEWAVIVGVIVFAGFVLWRYSGVLLRRRTSA